MSSDQYPLTWDDIDFADIRYVIEQACEPHLAQPIVQASFKAERAYDSPGTLAKGTNPEDSAASNKVKGQLRKYENLETNRLTSQLRGVDGGYLLAAVATIGSLPSIGYTDPVTAPGAYDREIEWLSTLKLPSTGRPPRWQEVFEAVRTSRRCLISAMYRQMPDDSPLKKLRDRSVFAKDLGGTYVPISQDMTSRLSNLLKQNGHKIHEGYLSSFKQETDTILSRYISNISSLVDQVANGEYPIYNQTDLISRIVSTWDVEEFIAKTAVNDKIPTSICVQDLIADLSSDHVDLRSTPLLKVREMTVLAFPRRVSCELHEVFDLAVGRYLQTTGESRGNYSDLRASMLDQLVADSLSKILPGSTLIVGEDWSIGGKIFERDVVALYQDIAVCVETKAPQMVPTNRANNRDVVSILKDDASDGVRQVCSIADSLEAGTAYRASSNQPIKVRRAYKLVATFNSWWGIDMSSDLLVESGVLPDLDSAMLTSADKFVCYEKLFPSPSDFISYLDHRRSHQRRTWLEVSDEFEMIGAYFTNPNGAWLRQPPPNTHYLVKSTFQDDVTQTIRESYLLTGRRSKWLQRKHGEPFLSNLTRWETHRPHGWLLAFSSVSRLSREVQLEIEIALNTSKPRGTKAIKVKKLSNGQCTLAIVFEDSQSSRIEWPNIVRNAELNIPFVAISHKSRRILAVRGVDESEIWIDPSWRQNTNASRSVRSQAGPPRRQRWQPKRSNGRHRRP